MQQSYMLIGAIFVKFVMDKSSFSMAVHSAKALKKLVSIFILTANSTFKEYLETPKLNLSEEPKKPLFDMSSISKFLKSVKYLSVSSF